MLSTFLSLSRLLVSIEISYVGLPVIIVICYVASACLYFRIYLAVRRHKNQIQALQIQQVVQNGEMAANVASASKSAVGTFYVFLVFLVCYLPHSFSLAFIPLHGSSASRKMSLIAIYTGMDPDVIQFIFKPCYLLLESETHKTCGHGHTAKYLSKSQLRKALTRSEQCIIRSRNHCTLHETVFFNSVSFVS